jgi:hypothetical protein
MQIHCSTSLSIYITMKKQNVCGFVTTDICYCFCMTKLCSSVKEADFSYYQIIMSQSFTQNSNKTVSGVLKHA